MSYFRKIPIIVVVLFAFLSYSCDQENNAEPTNEAPVISDQNFSIPENAEIGTEIGIVEASDPEEEALLFSIDSGNSDETFSINNSSGELILEKQLDFTTTPLYELSIKVEDSQNSSSAIVKIEVMEVSGNAETCRVLKRTPGFNGEEISEYVYNDEGLIVEGAFEPLIYAFNAPATATYEYDDQNRLIKRIEDYGGQVYTMTFIWNENQISQKNTVTPFGEEITTFTYENDKITLISVSGDSNYTIEYSYDSNGNITEMNYLDGTHVYIYSSYDDKNSIESLDAIKKIYPDYPSSTNNFQKLLYNDSESTYQYEYNSDNYPTLISIEHDFGDAEINYEYDCQ